MAMATTPAGVQTPPSAARAERLRRPLESPLPPPAGGGPPSGAPPPPPRPPPLSDRHLREIEVAFRTFDPSLSGRVDVPTFEVLARSLGFRATQEEIREAMEVLREEDRGGEGGTAADAAEAGDAPDWIDLPTAARILSRRGYADRDEEEELRMYFRIFDGGNKGHVTLEDLRRARGEVAEAEREMGVGSSEGGTDAGAVGDATLQAMIDQFDLDGDGVINYEEFKNVLGPVLSLPSSAAGGQGAP